MEERLSILEVESANTFARLSALEVKMRYARFEDIYRLLLKMDIRLDALTLELRGIRSDIRRLKKTVQTFSRWMVGSQIGIALVILIMASKMYFG